jgi:SpoVK/Ycf46/Vps4 family AAA+-type ATPase
MTSGAPGALAGYQFQLWFIASKIAEAYFIENFEVYPEAFIIPKPNINTNDLENEVVTIEDCVICDDAKFTHYDLKYLSPINAVWKLSDLKKERIIERLFNQHCKDRKCTIKFVSQSPCPLIQKVFKKAANSTNLNEFKFRLNQNKKDTADWNKIKFLLTITDETLFEFAKIVDFELVESIYRLKNSIEDKFKNNVTNDSFVTEILLDYAFECSKNQTKVNQQLVVNYLKSRKIFPKSHLQIVDIDETFRRASSTLVNWKNIFGRLNDSQIQREETQKVVFWIKAETEQHKQPLMLLVGAGGTGKTVILQQVYQSLQSQGISVLGIKADTVSAATPEELRDSLGFQEDIYKLLISASLVNNKVVVLIDQIDALSQTLSADRRSISNIYNLIQQLLSVPGIRVVVSCRKYDLHFDPLLQQFENKDHIDVSDLTKEQVKNILQSLNVDTKIIPDNLISLLQNPQHLNVLCQIYNESFNLQSISTLQDMYHKLWDQKVISKNTAYKLTNVLENIAIQMYNGQKIFINIDGLIDKWSREITYLLSEGVLVKSGNNCQFFHQSFFDYTFARFFVNKNQSISRDVHTQHQGLFIRSRVRQVISYLRATDNTVYFEELENLLGSKHVRTHIKFLIVNQLGLEANIFENEKELVAKHVIRDPILQIQLLESIRSQAWLNFLINENYLISFLNSSNETLSRSAGWMLESLVQSFPERVLSFIDSLSPSQATQKLIEQVLFRLEDWAQPIAIVLYDKIEPGLIKEPSFSMSHIFKNAVNLRPYWVKEKLDKYIRSQINSKTPDDKFHISKNSYIPHEIGQVLEKLNSLHPDIYFELALNLILSMVEKSKQEYKDCLLYSDWAFAHHDDYELIYDHWVLLRNIEQYLGRLAISKKKLFSELVKPLVSSNSTTLINVVVQTWNQKPTDYVEESYQLLIRKKFLEDYSVTRNGFGIEVRKLLRNMYPLYTITQKTELNKLLLNSECEYEKRSEYRAYRGRNQYLLLWSIPAEERAEYPEIRKRFLELERKFGKYEEKKIKESGRTVSAVGPPIALRAYKFMTFKQWLQTFKEFDDSTGWDAENGHNNPRGFQFGGLVEHSRAFADQVKTNPDQYFPFIETLLHEDVSRSYLAEALHALTEIKYHPQKLKKLIKSIGINYQNAELRKRVIWAIQYLANIDSVDLEIVSILEEFALRDPDPVEEIWIKKGEGGKGYYGGDPLYHGINTVRGSAIEALVIIGQKKEYVSKVFQILANLDPNCSVAIRCCAINHLAGLIQHDREKTEKIFLRLTGDFHPQVIKYGLNCLSYIMNHNFQLYRKHFEVAMQLSEKYGYETVQHYIGEVLMLAYAERLKGSKGFLENNLEISDDIKAGSLDFSIRHLTHLNPAVRTKARVMYKRLVSNQSESVQREYSRGFSQLEEKKFDELFPYILFYSKKGYGKKHEHNFLLEFLQKCVHSHPEKVLSILDNYFGLSSSEPEKIWYVDEPIQVLIGTYDRLNKGKKKKKELEQAMNVFDRMLSDQNLRSRALGILREMDYS